MEQQQHLWLVSHPLFDCISDRNQSGQVWSTFAEAFSLLIYSVPAFLGVTLARADSHARSLLEHVWAEELGTAGNSSHPVLFERLHQTAIARWGSCQEMHCFGADAASNMVSLCASGPWPVGVAAMLAHESQFPTAYSRILPRALEDLGPGAAFFQVHSLADVEHTSNGKALLNRAMREQIVGDEILQISYDRSTAILRGLADHAAEALNDENKNLRIDPS